MNPFLTYYVISLTYCFFQISKSWSKHATVGGLGITPGLDSVMLLMLCWALAPVDLFISFVNFYKKAEESRIRNAN